MRLDRLLSNAHAGTRSQVKKLVKEGRVKVNDMIAPHSSMQIDEETDAIYVDDKKIVYHQFVYYMLNKPAGYLSSTESGSKTVMDLMPQDDKGLFPCGRLDKDTEGLLLITNDGPLAHQLLSPKYHCDKEYYIEHASVLSDTDIKAIEAGIIYKDISYRPAVYHKITDTSCTLIIKEGKYHEIKLIFEAVDNHVDYLKRIRMKNLILDEKLRPGSYRELSEAEIEDLKAENR